MPELIEVEAARRTAERALGRSVSRVVADDLWFLKKVSPDELSSGLLGAHIIGARRIGKLLLLDMSSRHVLGLRFGMTGRLFVDGADGVGPLNYASNRALPVWDRFALEFDDGATLRLNDPRRLGGVELDPDENAFGPDAPTLTRTALAAALRGREAPLKASLLDQSKIAGLGNLLTDEILWRAGIDPRVPSGSVVGARLTRLHRTILAVVSELSERGGSHTGDLQGARDARGACPRCGVTLHVARVGGRTTLWCPRHQR